MIVWFISIAKSDAREIVAFVIVVASVNFDSFLDMRVKQQSQRYSYKLLINPTPNDYAQL